MQSRAPWKEIFCLILLLTLLPPAAATPADDWVDAGNTDFAQGDYEQALLAYEKAISLDPGHAVAWSNRGGALNNLKRYDEGLAASEKAIALDPKFAMAWSNKGVALYGLLRYDEALVALDRAIALDPNLPNAWNNRAAVLSDMKRYDEALPACDRAIALDPGLANAWNNKGVALTNLGRIEEALAALEQAVILDPTLAVAWSNRGDTLQKLGRSDEASASYQKARELDASIPIRTGEGPGTGITGYLVFATFVIALAGIVLFYRQRSSRPAVETVKAVGEQSRPMSRISTMQISGRSPPPSGTGHDVFISHAREDTAVAETVCRAMEHRGIRCWTPSRDLTPGTIEGEAIMEAINRSRVMVVVLSAAASRSAFVVRDLNAAVSHRVGILPLMIEDVLLPDSLDYLIGGIPGIRAAPEPAESDLADLADAVQSRLKGIDGAGNISSDDPRH